MERWDGGEERYDSGKRWDGEEEVIVGRDGTVRKRG